MASFGKHSRETSLLINGHYFLGRLVDHHERDNVVSLLQGRGSTIDYRSTASEARGHCLGPK